MAESSFAVPLGRVGIPIVSVERNAKNQLTL